MIVKWDKVLKMAAILKAKILSLLIEMLIYMLLESNKMKKIIYQLFLKSLKLNHKKNKHHLYRDNSKRKAPISF
jgi:hypothetical protein